MCACKLQCTVVVCFFSNTLAQQVIGIIADHWRNGNRSDFIMINQSSFDQNLTMFEDNRFCGVFLLQWQHWSTSNIYRKGLAPQRFSQ